MLAEHTLFRQLYRIAAKYPVPDIVEQLGCVAEKLHLPDTAEKLDIVVDTALLEAKNARSLR
ncbi:MAG TPA: hypothetical protein V6D15_08475 [Oculatellaceae cyanobacterium]